ncbi:glycosyltransferase [Pontibacter liquoris]|uniref:glycosyltransferase n=1 Tax=Pontibacter liquoris TaxID=2905677 RepID=UPI001FA71001|nr:glycosyltransferase [Pontibacter liquoris]
MEFTGERFLPIEGLIEDEIGIEHLHRYYSSLDLVNNKVVLDLACGEGYGSALLATVAKEVCGVDIDQSCIDHAKQKYGSKNSNLTFLQGNVTQVPLTTNSVDVVVSFETIEHLDGPTQHAFLKEIRRVLKHDGKLLISTPDKNNYSLRYSYVNEFHIKEFTKKEFFSFLNHYFDYSTEYLQGFEIVSAITETNTPKTGKLKVCNLFQSSKTFSRKYLIAICSNQPFDLENNFSSVVFGVKKDYQELKDRMVEMNAHIEELGAWGKSLDEVILQKDATVTDLQNKLISQSHTMQELLAQTSAYNEQLQKQTDELLHHTTTIQNKDIQVQELSERLTNKNIQVQELNERLTNKNIQVQELNERLTNKNIQVQELNERLTNKNIQVQELNERLTNKNIQVQELNERLTNKNIQVQELSERLTNKNIQVQELNERLVYKDEAISNHENSCQAASQLIKQLEQQLYNKDSQYNVAESENKLLRSTIETLTENINNLSSDKDSLEKYISDLKESINHSFSTTSKLEQDLSDCNNIILDQKQRIHVLYQQNDNLNGRLDEIFTSEGWKLLNIYYNIKGKWLPEDTSRYKYLKKAVNKVRGKKENYYTLQTYNLPAVQEDVSHPSASDLETLLNTAVEYEIIKLPFFDLPIASIVIPAYNAWEMNYKCIKSINENTHGVSYEVIIGDDASSDDTQNIGMYVENIVSIRNSSNVGFLHNCNNAAKHAKGKYILFLNNDTEVKPGWLSSLVELLEKDASIGMAGSKLIYPDGRLQEAGGIIWKDASGWNFGHRQSPEAPEFNYVKEVDYISGASILIRTSLWKEIGGFDSLYTPAYYEDTDLAFEVRKRGYKVVYQPLSEVIHYEGYSHGTEQREGITGKEIKAYQQVNFGKFYEKWKDVLDKDHFPNAENVFWAKDRSKGKKTILFVDHYVPFYDKDAGSRNTFMLLQLLAETGYNVKFIGDNFYKHEPYTTTLQQMGIEVLYGAWYRDNWESWALENKSKIDFVYLSRPHISIKYIDFICNNLNAKVIYFGHDLHYLRELKQYQVEGRKELLESSAKWKKLELELFSKSDLVLTVSEDEKTIINNDLNIQHVIKLPLFYYDNFKPVITDFADRKDILFVGGFGHSPNVDGIIWFCKQVWPQISASIPDVNFIIAGSNPPQEIYELSSPRIHVKGYVTDFELQALYNSVRLVVIPLRYGAGVKGKTVEAMYNGLPIVTTSFGVEGLSGIENVIQTCQSEEEFSSQVIDYYSSIQNLEIKSAIELDYVQAHFSRDAMLTVVNEIFS